MRRGGWRMDSRNEDVYKIRMSVYRWGVNNSEFEGCREVYAYIRRK